MTRIILFLVLTAISSLSFGQTDIFGCTISVACNYDSSATVNDGSCEFSSCAGCLEPSACNYDPIWTYHFAPDCIFPDTGYDCAGVCLLDTDGDGVCEYPTDLGALECGVQVSTNTDTISGALGVEQLEDPQSYYAYSFSTDSILVDSTLVEISFDMNVLGCDFTCSSSAHVLLFENNTLTNIWYSYQEFDGYSESDIPSVLYLKGSYTLVYGNNNWFMELNEGMGINAVVSQFSQFNNDNEHFTFQMDLLPYDCDVECDASFIDECGVCGGDGIAEGTCDCDGNVLDECGVCGGSGIVGSDIINVDFGDGLNIPDDQSQCFLSQLTVTSFNDGAIINDANNDIMNLFMNLEHSYMGDLIITLICPNGQSVKVHEQGGGVTWLGVPVDDESLPNDPGIGWDYWWEPGATNGTWADNTGGTLPSGVYESVEPFANLNGCPLNGTWEIEVCDLWASDNGFIFNWSLETSDIYFVEICDCDGNVLDECGVCGGDGIAEGECDCDGNVLDECGVCGGDGIAEGDCDCDGNVLDALGVCGGDCISDFNSNGICDDQEVFGCTYSDASNYNAEATIDDGSCIYEEYDLDAVYDSGYADGIASVICPEISNCPSDLDGNGDVGMSDLLIFLSAFGDVCEIPLDFSPEIDIHLANNIEGSTTSITYMMSQDNNESEIFSSSVVSDGGVFNLDGLVVGSIIGSGTLHLELYAGNYDISSNLIVSNIYNSNYTIFNEVTSSTSPSYNVGDIAGGFVISNSVSGISIYTEVPTDDDYITEAYFMSLTFTDLFTNPSSGNLTFTSTLTSELGDVDVQEFILAISTDDVYGCTVSEACNYDETATIDDGSCDFFSCLVFGCDNPEACNYDETVTTDDGTCDFISCADECGVPNGDGLSCLDECGVPNGDGLSCLDECGVSNGDNSTCLDECGVPNGDNSTCAGCDGVPNSGAEYDVCGVCGGDGSSCND
jgi:subtilisin-like proprotein convertase family protein